MTTAEAMEEIRQRGVKSLTKEDIKRLSRPILSTVRKRIKALEVSGMTSSPAYRGYIEQKQMTARMTKKWSTQRTELYNAFLFLEAKTSTVTGMKKYNRNLEEWLGRRTTEEEKESIWDAYHRVEKLHPEYFQTFKYDEIIKRVSANARKSGYDADLAYEETIRQIQRDITEMARETTQDTFYETGRRSAWRD